MTLTDLSYYSRKYAPLGVIILLILCIFYFAFQLFLVYVGSTTQTAVPTPSVTPVAFKTVFGHIPEPVIEGESSKGPLYFMDTIEGVPIQATPSATVYFIPAQTKGFGFLPRITVMAKEVGLDTDNVKPQTSGNIAQFRDGLRTMDIDITNFNFTFNYTLTSDTVKFKTDKSINESRITSAATEFLRDLNTYPEEIAQSKMNVVYMNFNTANNTLAVVQSIEQANMAEVDFYLPDLNGLSIVPPKYFNSKDFVLFAFSEEGLKPVRAQLQYHERSTTQFGFYPLKTGQQAFDDLKAGKGTVISGKGADGQKLGIKKMSVAYLDEEKPSSYLQPVFVFLGENNFVAYVPAIVEQFTAKK